MTTKLLTCAEAGEILGLSAETVRKMALAGTLKPKAVTGKGHRLFSPADVQALAELRRAMRGQS